MRRALLTLFCLLAACRGEPFQSSTGAAGASGPATGGGGTGGTGGSGAEPAGAGGTVGTGGVGATGGTGGTGGAPPTHQDVTVHYVSAASGAGSLPSRVLVVHDAAGLPVEVTVTVGSGAAVSVPIGGFVTVLEDFYPARSVYTAKILEGVTNVVFHQHQFNNPNSSTSGPFNGTCAGTNCGSLSIVEIHRSCEAPATFITTTVRSLLTHSVPTNGCVDTAELEVTFIVRNAGGFPVRFGLGNSTLPAVPPAIPLPTIPATDVTTFPVAIDDLLAGWETSRSIEARDPSGRVLRSWQPNDVLDPTGFHLINPLATNLLVARQASNDAPAFDLAITRFDNYTLGDPLPAFGLNSLALPNPPEAPLLTTPAQPLVSWSLGAGPLGQKMVLGLNDTNGTLSNWEVHVPAETSGSVLLPQLPSGPEYDAYSLGVADIAFYAHVSVDGADYGGALSSGIGLFGTARNAPSFTVGATIGQLP